MQNISIKHQKVNEGLNLQSKDYQKRQDIIRNILNSHGYGKKTDYDYLIQIQAKPEAIKQFILNNLHLISHQEIFNRVIDSIDAQLVSTLVKKYPKMLNYDHIINYLDDNLDDKEKMAFAKTLLHEYLNLDSTTFKKIQDWAMSDKEKDIYKNNSYYAFLARKKHKQVPNMTDEFGNPLYRQTYSIERLIKIDPQNINHQQKLDMMKMREQCQGDVQLYVVTTTKDLLDKWEGLGDDDIPDVILKSIMQKAKKI